MSSHSAIRSSTNSSWGSNPQDLQLQDTQHTSASSWTSHNAPHPSSNNGSLPFNFTNPEVPYIDQGTDPYLLHIGAQFYNTLDTGSQLTVQQAEWLMDSRYEAQPHSVTSDLQPMERYRQETLDDSPYVYTSHDGEVFGSSVVMDNDTQSRTSQGVKNVKRRI
jgi:hypothetical protein